MRLPRILFFCAASALLAGIQEPGSFFGHAPGAENKIIRWDGIVEYLGAVARNSGRVRLYELGKSTGGNPFVLAVISSPENLRNLERYKAINRRLFDPRRIGSDAEADGLVRQAKIFVLVTCSIHANEIGASQMAVEAAYRLATENSPRIAAILNSVIFLLVPSVDPDGQILVTDWYNRNLGTPHEDAPLPWLYHRYAGHDINRDAFMFTQKETRIMGRLLYRDWMPEVWLDLHQMGSTGPRVFVMPAMDPINPNVDPLVYRNAGLLGFAQAAALERAGKQGIIYGDVYTYWWEGAMAWAGLWHNMIGVLTEVASARIAGTVEQQMARPADPEQEDPLSGPALPASARIADTAEQTGARPADPVQEDLPSGPALPAPKDIRPRLQYPRPWLGGRWSLRDIVEHELIATFGLLETSANLRSQLLEGLYAVGKRQVELGKQGDPFAVVVPAEQPDRPTVVRMLQTLSFAGVEVHRARQPFAAGGRTYPPGTYVILMSQPFRAYAKDMLEPQAYPDLSTPPYDITGWSLGMQMGVETVFIKDPFQADLEKLGDIPLPPGRVTGRGPVYILSHEPNNSLLACNRLLAKNFDVSWLPRPATIGGKSFPPGAIIVCGGPDLGPAVDSLAASLGIDALAVEEPPAGAFRIRAPRTALYQPWGGNADEGWTRWLLEQNEFAYTTVHPQDIRSGDLSRYDAIIFPDMAAAEISGGLADPRLPEEFRGGIGKSGVRALEHFVEGGGTLITLGQSSSLALELGAPYRNSLLGVRPENFLCPGSILRIVVDNTHPVAFGMRTEANGYFVNSIALEPRLSGAGFPASVIVRYPDSDLLKSGWVRGESYLYGKIGAAEVKSGAGRMILLPLRVQHRAQPHGTFKLLFNAILTAAWAPAQ